MSKIVKVVVGVVAAAAIIVFAPYIAGFLAPILGSISATLTAATLTSSLVGMGIAMGLSSVAMLFRKTPSNSQSLVDRLNTQVNPTAPRKIVFGLTAAGQDIRFQEKHDLAGTKKDGWSEVVALASHRINKVVSWTIEDKLTWSGGAIQGDYSKGILGFEAVLEGNVANGRPVGSGNYWTSAAHFTGCAYTINRFKLDPDVWQGSIPTRRTTVVEGCPVYDPRLDSTRGGSGSHRINDNSTWEYRHNGVEIGRNPALCLLTYLIGWRIFNPTAQKNVLAWGMGVPVERIDLANFRLYANICEEQVAIQAGGNVQRYTCDGMFSTADTHETVHNAITAAMGSCKLVDVGGMYQLIGGYDDTLGPRLELTADDISEYQWDPAPSQRETFNIARGRYVSPENLYQLEDWPEIRLDPLADGYDRPMSLDLGCVTRPETAQRIAKQFLAREALAPGYFSATVGPRGFGVEVGGLVWISLSSQGWNRKLFRCVEQAESYSLVFQMKFREESSAIYAWDREEKEMPANIRPPGWDPRETLQPENLRVSSNPLVGGDGSTNSFLSIAWDPEKSGRVQSIQIQTKAFGQIEWGNAVDRFDARVGVYQTSSPVPGVVVQVRARFRMTTGIYGPWVEATPVESVNASYVDGTARDQAQQAQDDADEALDTANNVSDAIIVQNVRVGEAIDLIEEIRGVMTSNQDAISRTRDLLLLDTQTKVGQVWSAIDETGNHVTTLQTTLVQKVDNTVAAYREQVDVVAGDLAAEVTAREQLAAKIDGDFGEVAAAIDEERRVRVEKDGETLATMRNTLSVGLANAGGLTVEEMLKATGDAVKGYNGSWSIRMNNNSRIAGVALNSNPQGVSSFGVVADKFEIVDPDDNSGVNAPFRFENGILFLNDARIRNANIDNLTIAGEKLEMNAVTMLGEFKYLPNFDTRNFLQNYYTQFSTAQINTGPVPEGTKIRLDIACECSGGDDGKDIYWRVLRSDGVYLNEVRMTVPDEHSAVQNWFWTDIVQTAGTYIYYLQGKCDDGARYRNVAYAGSINKR